MHHQRHLGSSAPRLLLLMVVALLAVAALAAAPAVAATGPAAPTLTVSPQAATVNWGATAILNGTLQTAAAPPLPVDGQLLYVEYATSPTGPSWTRVLPAISNNPADYGTGAYTYSFKASRNYCWRMVFAGTAEYAEITSQCVQIKVRPRLGRPACPASVKANKKFTVVGSLKPRFTPGSKTVKVRAQRYAGGKWRTYKTWLAKNANSGAYSKYSVRVAISKKGKYRFYATSAGTSTFAAAKSTYSRSLRVK
jgi:hypothetical protein